MEDTQKIDLLIESLKHPEKKVIRQAAERLIAMAPQVPELAPKLNRLLTITPDQYRWPIAYVLAQISPPSPPCLEVLKETLGSGDSDIRWAAAVLLVRLGNADKGVTALLRDLLRTGTPTQRRMAVYCIRDSDQNQACVEALLDSLRDPDPLVRVASVTSLKAYATISKAGRDSLLRLFLSDPDARVRRNTALTLGQLGASDEEVGRALSEACQSGDPLLRKAARSALDLRAKKGPAERD